MRHISVFYEFMLEEAWKNFHNISDLQLTLKKHLKGCRGNNNTKLSTHPRLFSWEHDLCDCIRGYVCISLIYLMSLVIDNANALLIEFMQYLLDYLKNKTYSSRRLLHEININKRSDTIILDCVKSRSDTQSKCLHKTWTVLRWK